MMGSGVIVDANGYIITNQHVVDRADRIQVRLFDDPTDYEAKLIGVDRETDLAVIRMETTKKLVAAAIGNSDAVQVGEWAIAIGAPFGFEPALRPASSAPRDAIWAHWTRTIPCRASCRPTPPSIRATAADRC